MTTTHIDDEQGLWIPPDYREFSRQIVIRTPRATVQHFGDDALDAHYGMIDESHFGPADSFTDPKNPTLAPNEVRIMPEDADGVTLTVEDVSVEDE